MLMSKLGEYTGHFHHCLKVPMLEGILDGEAEAHLDILVIDRNHDGDYNVEVKWDLPGTTFDSGPEPKLIPVPVATLMGPVAGLVGHALKSTGAPGLLISAIVKLLTSD